MKALTFICSFIFTFAVNAEATYCKSSDNNFCNVKVGKVYDGDTITVDLPNIPPVFGRAIGVRILGIDTAEIRGKSECEKQAARTARKLVENLIKNAKQVDILNVQRDKYFRILGDVSIDGKLVKEILIKNKLAVLYFGKTKEKINWCERLPASK